jgi:chromosome segregation ATPase
VFFKSAIIKGLAKMGLALNSRLAEARRERDLAVAELEGADAKYDRFPAALQSALTERDAFRKQRDQAYGEIDDLCQERNELKGQLERLRRQGLIPDRDHP